MGALDRLDRVGAEEHNLALALLATSLIFELGLLGDRKVVVLERAVLRVTGGDVITTR